jgi:hypothetical protein
MSYKNSKSTTKAGARKTQEPRLVGSIIAEMLQQGWHANTDLGCEVKTLLRSERRMQVGREYQGVFRLDASGMVDEYRSRDPHYTFIEAQTAWVGKRNLHLFNGKYISVTRQDDGALRLNFKRLDTKAGFSVERYALGVHNEICMALEGLVGE